MIGRAKLSALTLGIFLTLHSIALAETSIEQIEQIRTTFHQKAFEAQNYLMMPEPAMAQRVRDLRKNLQNQIQELKRSTITPEQERLISAVEASEQSHQNKLQDLMTRRRAGAGVARTYTQYKEELQPLQLNVESKINELRSLSSQLASSAVQDSSTELTADANKPSVSARVYPVLLFIVTLGMFMAILAYRRQTKLSQESKQQLAFNSNKYDKHIDEIRATQEKLSHALRLKDEVIEVLSHDLKEPISLIQVAAILLERRAAADEYGHFVLQQAVKIRHSSERIQKMIDDLVDLTKIETGEYPLTRRRLSGLGILKEAIELMAPIAAEESVSLELQPQSENREDMTQVHGDHDQMIRALTHLIDQAIRLAPEDGRVMLDAHSLSKSELEIEVSQSNPGSMSSTSTLGMSLAKGIVEAHGGRVQVETRSGHGLRFSVTLPKDKQDPSVA